MIDKYYTTQLYWGLGKGKTSAANGGAIRAKGAGNRVAVFRFLKGQHTSEDELLQKCGIFVEKIHHGTKFVLQMNDEEKKKVKEVIDASIERIKAMADQFDLIVLDEVLDLCVKNVAMLESKQLEAFIKELQAKEIDLILTGHEKDEIIFKLADTITHFQSERHHFENGIPARKGIEY